MKLSPSWKANRFSASEEIVRILWNPHSQESPTCPCHEPDQPSPCPPQSTSWGSILILSSHQHLGLPSDLFPSGFPTTALYTSLLSSILDTLSVHLILLNFIARIIFVGEYKSLNSPLCSFLQPSVTWFHLGPHIRLSTLFSNILSLCLPSMWGIKFHTHTKKQEKL